MYEHAPAYCIFWNCFMSFWVKSCHFSHLRTANVCELHIHECVHSDPCVRIRATMQYCCYVRWFRMTKQSSAVRLFVCVRSFDASMRASPKTRGCLHAYTRECHNEHAYSASLDGMQTCIHTCMRACMDTHVTRCRPDHLPRTTLPSSCTPSRC